MDYIQLNNFSNKWINKFKNPNIEEEEFFYQFSDDCFYLGMEMDSFRSLHHYLVDNQIEDFDLFDPQSLGHINDIKVLFNTIFSNWRRITRDLDSLTAQHNRQWFIASLERLQQLVNLVTI